MMQRLLKTHRKPQVSPLAPPPEHHQLLHQSHACGKVYLSLILGIQDLVLFSKGGGVVDFHSVKAL